MRTPSFILLALFSSFFLPTACNKDKAASDQEKELTELRQLAALDRQEMEKEYAQSAAQFAEMKVTIKNDSLLARLDAEQQRAEKLLRELRAVKNNSSAEILRLKKELATVRAVLQTYIRQVDSLMQVNQTLVGERDEARQQVLAANSQVASLSTERENLTQKVAIAAQLDATHIALTGIKKNGKAAKKTKDITRFQVQFTISRNVTAKAGQRMVYVRLLKPNQSVLNASGNFPYESKVLAYSASKSIEYGGQELTTSLVIPVAEVLEGGTYTAYIFADGQMIGQGNITFEK